VLSSEVVIWLCDISMVSAHPLAASDRQLIWTRVKHVTLVAVNVVCKGGRSGEKIWSQVGFLSSTYRVFISELKGENGSMVLKLGWLTRGGHVGGRACGMGWGGGGAQSVGGLV